VFVEGGACAMAQWHSGQSKSAPQTPAGTSPPDPTGDFRPPDSLIWRTTFKNATPRMFPIIGAEKRPDCTSYAVKSIKPVLTRWLRQSDFTDLVRRRIGLTNQPEARFSDRRHRVL